jgi:hypothetical protein
MADRGLAARHKRADRMIMAPVTFCAPCRPFEYRIGAQSSELMRYKNGELRSKGDGRNPSGSEFPLFKRWWLIRPISISPIDTMIRAS